MTNKKEKNSFIKSKFRKKLIFFGNVVSINKVWFICSIIAPVVIIFIFSFIYLSEDGRAKWDNSLLKLKESNSLSRLFNAVQFDLLVFFGLFYLVVFSTITMFAFFLFFYQLRNKKFRFAFYSGLSRNEVFFILLFVVIFYVFINSLIDIIFTTLVKLPYFQSTPSACWEIFNIYMNVLLLTILILLGGYLLWNKSLVLYIVLVTISTGLIIIFACICRFDFLVLFIVKNSNKYNNGISLVRYSTLMPESFLGIIKCIPIIFSSMTSVMVDGIDKFINLIYFIVLGGLATLWMYFLNRKISL
ncbi:hypothetical protein [Spiroplasma endosymbiont of Aspidapion aeneum]|uniref:hypothetical protein n=1 Tax=Spiroplasma endosymbiont of Aspidapion aeneum TaxID=3066276 RepID=UPI00313B6349